MHNSFDIITVGSSLRDIIFYADTGAITHKQVWELQYGGKVASDRVFVEFGGGASNAAVSCARLGLNTAIISSIGRDEYGDSIRSHLYKEHVDVDMMHVSSRHTGFSFILVHQKTGEHIAFIHYGAAEECLLPKHIAESRWTYISSLNSTDWDEAVVRLAARKTQVAWNPGSRQLSASKKTLLNILPQIDVLILNEEELGRLNAVCGHNAATIKERITAAQSTGVPLIVVTRGKKGSIAYDGSRIYTLPKVTTRPIDTTGAGDSYGSAFVAGFLRYNGDVHKSMQLAALNSEKNVAVIGAQQGLLYARQLPKVLNF